MKTNTLTVALMCMASICCAHVIQVTNLNDSGPGSLRQAVADANEQDTIDLRGLSGTIFLATTIVVNKQAGYYFLADGFDKLVIDGSGIRSPGYYFEFETKVFLQGPTFDGLSFKNSNANKGFDLGDVSVINLRNCIFENNLNDGGIFGTSGNSLSVQLNMESCTFFNNRLLLNINSNTIFQGLNITQCTFFQIEKLFNLSNVGAFIRISNSTFKECGVLIKDQGPIHQQGPFFIDSNLLDVDLIADNLSYIFIGSNNIGTNADDLGIGLDIDPLLSSSLTYNLGPTPVLVPLEGSPAIDAGLNPMNLVVDQTGGTRSKGRGIDIGAFETGYISELLPIDLGPDIIVCTEDSVTLDAGGNYVNYLWSTGETGQILKVFKSGEYIVVGTNEFGDSNSDTINIVLNPIVLPIIAIESSNCSSLFKLSVNSYSSYLWSTGVATPSIEVTQSGEYGVEVVDNHGCTGTATVSLVINSDPLCGPGAQIKPLLMEAVCSELPLLTRRWKLTNPNTSPIRVDWEITSSIEKSWLDLPPGESYLTTVLVPKNSNILKIYWHNEKGEKKTIQQTPISTKCAKNNSAGRIAMDSEASEPTEPSVRVYPNPGNHFITIEVVSDVDVNAPLEIISTSGVVHQKHSVMLSKGNNFITQDISQLTNGAYIITAGYQSVRFVKE